MNADLLTQVVRELTATEPADALLYHHADGHPLPSLGVLTEIVDLCRAILFPGYFGHSGVSDATLVYHTGVNVETLYHKLVDQVKAGLCFAEKSACAHDEAENIASEFIGRLPVNVTLDALDEKALVSILTEPKNALVKQYVKLMELDNVELSFEDEALSAIAHQAIERKCGARGLRSIIERALLDIMFEIPGSEDVEKCVVHKDVIEKGEKPRLVLKEKKVHKPRHAKKEMPQETESESAV